MTKVRLTCTLSNELYDVIALCATAKQMNTSEYVETRLRMLPEIQKHIEMLKNLPEMPIVDVEKIKKQRERKNKKRKSFKFSKTN